MAGDNGKNRKGFAGLSDLVSDVSDTDLPIKTTPKAVSRPSEPQQTPEGQSSSGAPKSEPKNTNTPQPVGTVNPGRNNVKSQPKTEPTPPSAPKQLSQPQQGSATSKSECEVTSPPPTFERMSSGGSKRGMGGKWFIGLVGLILVSWLIWQNNNGSHGNKNPSYNPPSSSQSSYQQSDPTPAVADPRTTKSAGLHYTKPSAGTDNVLSVPEIRWCIREDIRIGAMRDVVDTNEGIDKFNQIVNDYNSRCGNYRYRQGTQAQAERDVEPYRNQIVTEVIQEAKGINQPGLQKVAPGADSLAQSHSFKEQEPSPSQGTPLEAKETSTPFFDISDLDCQKSPVICKDWIGIQ